MQTISTSTLSSKSSKSRVTNSPQSGRGCGNSCAIKSSTPRRPRKSGTRYKAPTLRAGIWKRISGRRFRVRGSESGAESISAGRGGGRDLRHSRAYGLRDALRLDEVLGPKCFRRRKKWYIRRYAPRTILRPRKVLRRELGTGPLQRFCG